MITEEELEQFIEPYTTNQAVFFDEDHRRHSGLLEE